MSDATYPKSSRAPKASKAPAVAQARSQPADDYEDYDEYDDVAEGDEWEYEDGERQANLVTSPGRAIALGVAGVALLAVFSAVIWLISTSQPPGPPPIVNGAAGGVPVIRGFAQTTEAQAASKGAFAPDFVWNDSNNQAVALSSFRGTKPVFVNFWGTWCPPCRSEMPAMEQFYQQHKDQIQVIGISMAPRDDPATVLGFVKDAKYSWKFIHDGDYKVAEKYGIASVPSSFFIDKNGIIKAVQVGAMNEGQIESYFQQVK